MAIMELWVERPKRQATNQSAKKYIRKSCDLFGIFNISALPPTKMMLCNLNIFRLSFVFCVHTLNGCRAITIAESCVWQAIKYKLYLSRLNAILITNLPFNTACQKLSSLFEK